MESCLNGFKELTQENILFNLKGNEEQHYATHGFACWTSAGFFSVAVQLLIAQ